MKEKQVSKIGRPYVTDKKKKSSHIYINLTALQKIQLEKIAEEEDRSLSQLCIQALKKAKYL